MPEAGADGSTLDRGLVSWWRGEGDAADSIGPNNGTIQGGVTFVPGKVGQSFQFDGTSGDILIAPSATLNLARGYTVAFWINVPAWPASEMKIMIKFVASAETKQIVMNANGTIGLGLFNVAGNSIFSSATPLTLGTWHHFTATYDGSNENIYIDGNLDVSRAALGNIVNSTGALSFAHSAALGSAYGFFAGNLDEIRWYSRALSGSEVAALRSAN